MTGRACSLALRRVTRSFPGVVALDGVDLEIHRGEVHALVGANGAGKSTLVRILGGALQPEAGRIELEGRAVRLRSVADAQAHGIAVVHQERTLVPHLTGAENILLGTEPTRAGVILAQRVRAAAAAVAERLGVSVPLDLPVRHLGAGEQQLVDLLKALRRDPRVLVLDEPTASLSAHESSRLCAFLRALRAREVGIVFVSHRLDEVFALADRISVLRDGRVVGSRPASAWTPAEVVREMVRVDARAGAPARPAVDPGPVLLEAERLGGDRFVDVSLTLRARVVVGLAGVVGAGRTELLETLAGARRRTHGTVRVRGQPAALRSPGEAVRAGIVLIPEKRSEKGLIERLTVRENVALPSLPSVSPGGVVRSAWERRLAETVIERLQIAAPGPEAAVRTLSGGTKQKVVVGKWLLRSGAGAGRIFLFDEPTEGIDVRTRLEMWTIIGDLAGAGAAVLFASSDLDELTTLADEILVMRGGRVVGAGPASALDRHRILEQMLLDRARPMSSGAVGTG